MPVTIPPWLNPINPVPYYLQGVQIGENIAERQNAAERAIQEMTLRREAQQRAREQAQAEMAIHQQQLAIQQQLAQQKAQDAARKYQWNQELSQRIESGEDPMAAWESTAPKYNPRAYGQYQMQKQAQQATAEQRQASADALADYRASQLGLSRERLEESKALHAASQARSQQSMWQRQYDNLDKKITKLKQARATIFDPDDKARVDADLKDAMAQLEQLQKAKPEGGGNGSTVLRRKSDGKRFYYKGDPEDVDEEDFDIID